MGKSATGNSDMAQNIQALRIMQQACTYISSVFLVLPDEEMVANLISVKFDDLGDGCQSRGIQTLAGYVDAERGRGVADILLDISRDRVKLMRAVDARDIKPPYECLYVGAAQNETVGSLNQFYAQLGIGKTKECKDSADQLGVELAFLAELCSQEAVALEAFDDGEASRLEELRMSFCSQHLSRWAGAYAEAMERAASTGFYRGVAQMLRDLPL